VAAAPTAQLAALDTIKGATPRWLCETLYDLAATVPADQAIVEIGVFHGRSACYLGAGARSGHGAHVWAIDPWDLPGERKTYMESVHGLAHREGFTDPETRKAAEANIARFGLTDQVTPWRAFSVQAAAEWDGPPVGLLYVDGDHHAEAVRGDFEAWRPHLAPGALVAFDDHEPPFFEVIETVAALAAEGRITAPDVHGGRLALATVP
jgi:predicted O-methyltransferase YrrM